MRVVLYIWRILEKPVNLIWNLLVIRSLVLIMIRCSTLYFLKIWSRQITHWCLKNILVIVQKNGYDQRESSRTKRYFSSTIIHTNLLHILSKSLYLRQGVGRPYLPYFNEVQSSNNNQQNNHNFERCTYVNLMREVHHFDKEDSNHESRIIH